MRALLRLALAACLVLPLATRAADARAHLDSIRTMLVELELVEAYLASSRKIIDDAGPDLAWLDRELSSAEALERMVPIYARYLSADEAAELTAFFSKPPGEKAWNFLLERMRGSDGLPSTPLAWHEKQAVDTYLKTSPGWKAYRAAHFRKVGHASAVPQFAHGVWSARSMSNWNSPSKSCPPNSHPPASPSIIAPCPNLPLAALTPASPSTSAAAGGRSPALSASMSRRSPASMSSPTSASRSPCATIRSMTCRPRTSSNTSTT